MALASRVGGELSGHSIPHDVSGSFAPLYNTATAVNSTFRSSPRAADLWGGLSAMPSAAFSADGIYRSDRVAPITPLATSITGTVTPGGDPVSALEDATLHVVRRPSSAPASFHIASRKPASTTPPAADATLYIVGPSGSIGSRKLDHRDTDNQKRFQEAIDTFKGYAAKALSVNIANVDNIGLVGQTITYTDAGGKRQIRKIDAQFITAALAATPGLTKEQLLEPIRTLRHIAEVSAGVTLAWPSPVGSPLRGPEIGDAALSPNTRFVGQHSQP